MFDSDDEFEEFMKRFMKDMGGGVQALDINSIPDHELEKLERLMEEVILPQLLLSGMKGDIGNVKVIRVGDKPKDPDADLGWLDKYLK